MTTAEDPLLFYDDLPGEPVVTGRQALVAERAHQLKAHPGRWARWPVATATVKGVQRSLDKFGDGFEVVARVLDGGKGVLARYVGPGGDALDDGPASNGSAPAADEDDETTSCPACDTELVVAPGRSARSALEQHLSANVRCRQAARAGRTVR